MKKYSKQEQTLLAIWALDCAERVLGLFEKARPENVRPRKAIEEGRAWTRNGIFKMAAIREASLGAHAAAREVKGDDAAVFAARAAGQAVATAHVTQHAFGAAYYALKAILAANPVPDGVDIMEEYTWQIEHVDESLREEVLKVLVVRNSKGKIEIRIQKDEDF